MQAAATTPATSPVEAEVLRIRGLLERNQFGAALSAAEALAVKVPENRDVLYMIAVSQRYLQRVSEALATLERLERLHPGFSRLYQERGHCFVALRDAAQAIEAFLRAVNINPALPASWRTLQTLYRMTGQAANAEMAAGHVAALAKLPPEIVMATAMFSDGELVPAEGIVRAYLLKHGDHVEAMRLLARIGLQQEVLDDAETLLEAVLTLAPDYRAARYDYAMALLRRHKHVQAVAELDKLLELDPGNRIYRTSYATAQVGLGDHERALGLYRELVADAEQALPASELHLSIAHSLKALGRQQESIDAYHAAAAARPNYGDAYWSLANLKTYRFSDDEIARMRAEEAVPTIRLVDRYHMCFALGKALEDRAEYADIFRRRDAAQQDDVACGPDGAPQRRRALLEGRAVARVREVDIPTCKLEDLGMGDLGVGALESGDRRDDMDVVRCREATGVRQLAAEIEAAEKREHVAERRASGRPQPLGQIRFRSRRQQLRGASAAAARRRQDKNRGVGSLLHFLQCRWLQFLQKAPDTPVKSPSAAGPRRR